MSTIDAIRNSAVRHDELIRQIGELDYAPTALQNQQEHINGLARRLTDITINIQKFEKITKKEERHHRDVANSIVRKFAYRMTGQGEKFNQRITKEEKEFAEALDKEMRAKEQAEMLRGMLEEGTKVVQDLAAKTARHTELKAEVDQLYKSIFDGPTSEFPRDDQLERTLHQAQQYHDQVQQWLNKESLVVDLLQRADDCCNSAEMQMREALSCSTWEMWGGGVGTEMMEQSALNSATSLASQAEMMVYQASMQTNKSGDVQPVPALQLPQVLSFGDVFFNNIITEMNVQDKIERSAAQLQSAHGTVKAQLVNAIARANMIGNDLLQASNKLLNARLELATYRKNVFDQVARENGGRENGESRYAEPAPQYMPPPYPPSTSAGEQELPSDKAQGTAQERAAIPRPAWGSRNPFAAHLTSAGGGEKSPCP